MLQRRILVQHVSPAFSRRRRIPDIKEGGAAGTRGRAGGGRHLSLATPRALVPGPRILEAGPGEADNGPDGINSTGPEGSPEPRFGHLRVAVVEDEAVIAIDIEDMLLALGAEVVGIALTAEGAVKLAEAERPDLVTMDIRLQGQRDGISAATEIYERFGIRSVFISAYGDAETVARAQRASPLGWIAKPLRREELEAALEKVPPRHGGS